MIHCSGPFMSDEVTVCMAIEDDEKYSFIYKMLKRINPLSQGLIRFWLGIG